MSLLLLFFCSAEIDEESLFSCIRRNQIDVLYILVEKFLKDGIDIKKKWERSTVFTMASEFNRLECLQYLVERGLVKQNELLKMVEKDKAVIEKDSPFFLPKFFKSDQFVK